MKRLAAGVVMALVGMRAFFAVFQTYLPSGADLAPAPGAWQGAGAPGVGIGSGEGPVEWALESTSNRSASVEFAVTAVAGMEAIELRAWCAADGIRPGRHRYQTGRLILAFVDANGKSRWDRPHVAGAVWGTRGWTPVGRRFVVPPGAVSARVILSNQGEAGVLRVRGLSVVPMRMNPWTPLVFAAWGAVWAAGAWMAARRLRLGSRRGGRAVTVAALAVVAGMLLPERAISAVGTGLRHASRAIHRAAVHREPVPPGTATGASPAAATAPPMQPKPAQDPARVREPAPSMDIHKAGHLAVFAWLAVAAAGCFGITLMRTAGTAAGIGALVLYAFAAEQLQWLTLTRSANLADIGYNLIGIAAGLLIAEAWRALRRRPAA